MTKTPYHAKVHTGFQGVVESVELIESTTGEVELKLGPYKNLIVDAGLDAIGNAAATGIDGLVARCGVGTGNSTPAVGQTALDAEIGTRVAVSNSSGPTYMNPGTRRTYVYEFAAGNATGSLAEFGFFANPAGTPMWARQLFLDGTLTPVTINKTASKILRITYSIWVFPNLSVENKNIDADIKGVITPTSVDYQPQAVNAWSWVFNAFPSWGSGGSANNNFHSWPDNTPAGSFTATGPLSGSGILIGNTNSAAGPYTNGTFFRDRTWAVGISNHNQSGGIGAIAVAPISASSLGSMPFIMLFNPKIDKTSADTLSITVRFSWGRV